MIKFNFSAAVSVSPVSAPPAVDPNAACCEAAVVAPLDFSAGTGTQADLLRALRFTERTPQKHVVKRVTARAVPMGAGKYRAEIIATDGGGSRGDCPAGRGGSEPVRVGLHITPGSLQTVERKIAAYLETLVSFVWAPFTVVVDFARQTKAKSKTTKDLLGALQAWADSRGVDLSSIQPGAVDWGAMIGA